jgi:hypothetical protein
VSRGEAYPHPQVGGVTVLRFPCCRIHLLPKRAADPDLHRPQIAVAKGLTHDRAVGDVGDLVELDEVAVVGGALMDELAASRPPTRWVS